MKAIQDLNDKAWQFFESNDFIEFIDPQLLLMILLKLIISILCRIIARENNHAHDDFEQLSMILQKPRDEQ